MQVSKAGVIAAGALATVAAMGSPAAAMPAASHAKADLATAATTLDLGPAAARQAEPAPQPLITIGVGSAVQAASWQVCGGQAVAGVGGVVTANSDKVQVGDCNNANVLLKQDTVPGVISILDDSSVNVVPWQVCGSNVVAGVGLSAAVNSAMTVVGDCNNANTLIKGAGVPGTQSVLSVLSGTVLNVLPWQVCGSTAVMGVGAAVGTGSPTTVIGDCNNAGVAIQKLDQPAGLPVLSNANLNLLPLQVCEQNGLASLVGLSPALNSPALVTGECNSPQGLDVQP